MPRFSSEENRHRRMDTDTAVAEQEARLAELTKDRRDRLRWALGFIDSSAPSETSFDRTREGRSAT